MNIIEFSSQCQQLTDEGVLILKKNTLFRLFDPHEFGEVTFYKNLKKFLKNSNCQYLESQNSIIIYKQSRIISIISENSVASRHQH